MYKTRIHYWSCSKFADWVRGKNKGSAKTSKGWNDWHKDTKANNPIRYWIAETLLDNIQDVVYFPYDVYRNVKAYYSNRFISKSNALTADPAHIKPGQWRDFGHRILPCLFDELVKFVETDLAMMYPNSKGDHKTRDPISGLKHLEWAMSLTNGSDYGVEENDPKFGQPTHQALVAKEILELYTWWTTVYPYRPEPSDVSGWSEYCKNKRGDDELFISTDETPEERENTRKILDHLYLIEKKYHDEETEMLIRLIKIRDDLWT
jgi:hypothetical protein